MLTLFSVPKPFTGPIGVIQRNAIRSWTLLGPECEILLLGDEPGTAEAAAECGARHLPSLARNEYGTPLLDHIFEQAETAATHGLMGYINADIILMSDFLPAVRPFQNCPQKFLLAQQRWDVDIKEPWDFADPEWELRLRRLTAEKGKLHNIAGLDYFIFRKGLYGKIPPFALGRCVWDNWLLWRARDLGAALVNLTYCVTIIHQNHDYNHVTYTPHLPGWNRIYDGPERQRNLELAGGTAHMYDLSRATHVLRPKNTSGPAGCTPVGAGLAQREYAGSGGDQ